MEFKIIGQTVPTVEVTLRQGEGVYTQSGGMTYQTDGIEMSTGTKGGVMKGIGRMFSGESMFMTTYKANKDDALIGFATTVPGNIIPLNISEYPKGFMLQKGAFLCAQESVDLNIAFTQKISAGLVGGEGFILQKATGKGMLFLEVDGDPIIKDLAHGEVLKVDTGNVVAFDTTVSYEVESVKGLKNILLGGEGLFLTKLVGPGRVIIQSQNFVDFASKVGAFVPRK